MGGATDETAEKMDVQSSPNLSESHYLDMNDVERCTSSARVTYVLSKAFEPCENCECDFVNWDQV